MSLLTIRCWLHVIKTLQFVRTGIHSLEKHVHRDPGVAEYRNTWDRQLATESHEIEDELRVLARGQKTEDDLVGLVGLEVIDDG